jgi:hypothetical protein
VSEHNLLVVSDLHLSEGFLLRSGKLSPNEDFLSDDSFASFLHFHGTHRPNNIPWRLIIAGDVSDLFQVAKQSSKSNEDPSGKRESLKRWTESISMSVIEPMNRPQNALD